MPKDIAVDGVYVTPFVGFYLATFVLFLAARLVIVRADLERWFWRPEIAETGLFLAIFALVVTLF
jgi:hypothetical protein